MIVPVDPGGTLVLFEKVLAPTARSQDLTQGVYHDFKRRQGFSNEEIAAKTRSLRGVLQPLSACDNYEMLQHAGFTDVVQLFRWIVFDGVIAYV